jgi:hypothetical protein
MVIGVLFYVLVANKAIALQQISLFGDPYLNSGGLNRTILHPQPIPNAGITDYASGISN